MFLFTMIGTFIALCISAFISVLISQPFTGAVIRLRANYLPKAVSLDNILEDGAMEGGGSDGFGGTSGVTPRKISAYWLNRGRQTAKIVSERLEKDYSERSQYLTSILSHLQGTRRIWRLPYALQNQKTRRLEWRLQRLFCSRSSARPLDLDYTPLL